MSAANTFDGQVALVTGGGSGIGRAICLLLARDGARVLVTDVNLEGARHTLSLLPGSAVHLALQMDVTQHSSIEDVIATAREKFGEAPRLLVNCAGICKVAPIQDAKEHVFNELFDVNLKPHRTCSHPGQFNLHGSTPSEGSDEFKLTFKQFFEVDNDNVDMRRQAAGGEALWSPSVSQSVSRSHAVRSTMSAANNTFDGQVALVTGGGSGIGRAICLLLARDGARVLVTDVNLEGARHTLSLLPGSSVHLALQMDVTQLSAVEGVIAAARDKFGAAPRLLVNCAGINEMVPFLDIKEDRLNRLIDVNLKGTFLVTQAFTRALLEDDQGAGEGKGAIVNISSIAARKGVEKFSHYAGTKGGVVSFTKTCAAELTRKGIRVNCVLPGAIETPMGYQLSKDPHKEFSQTNLLGRLGRPEEVAEVVVVLLSKRSSFMVGASVDVTAGW